MTTQQAIRLYSFPLSGHVHRVKLLLSMLALPHEVIDVNIPGGEHKQPDFIKLNPRGQIPVIVDGDVTLYDSTAILVYLAKRYGGEQWLPSDPLGAAHVQQFLSLAAGEIFEGPNRVRLVKLLKRDLDYSLALEKTLSVLGLLEQHLAGRDFLAAGHATIADLACYAYVAHVPEGGVDLAPYPNVRGWIARVEQLPRFVPMVASPHAIAA
ncbi:glutathione S-transferase [Herbaspirillum sp. WKF16]|jgi:glutathione S-transferase|uniref:glutathione S-transferase family protein n=1 Tax=Herbaspirillum sp. WKF16 TaxID=3028312 RepID=UPI0023A98241|nr:glutathione S-transferase [Herbaspirillum sp. WKF16]WDZ96005.1 glutathione S-transferase [Herbaspirillum sp. WKF16]